VLVISLSLAALVATPLASAMAAGLSYCRNIPDVEELKKTYIEISSPILLGWDLVNIDASCGGTLHATYSLPAYSDNKTSYLVQVFSIHPYYIRDGKPFTDEFIQDHDQVVADKVQAIRARDIFKEAHQGWSNITVQFSYPPESQIKITGYNQVNTCASQIDIEELEGTDIVSYEVSNDVDMNMSLPIINLAREYINGYLTNYYNLSEGFDGLKPVTESSCGKTTGYDSDSGFPLFTTGHAVYADVECEVCPSAIQVNMYDDDMIPLIYTDLSSDGTPLKTTLAQGSALSFIGEFNGSISLSSPALRNAGGKTTESANVGELVIPSVRAHNGASGMLSCVIVIELRDENGVTVALKLQERVIPQGNLADAGLVWRPENAGSYQIRGFMVDNLENPEVLTDVKITNITVYP